MCVCMLRDRQVGRYVGVPPAPCPEFALLAYMERGGDDARIERHEEVSDGERNDDEELVP